MAYIGQSPVDTFSPVPSKDSFTGDGSTTTFDLNNAVVNGGENALEVFVNNVRQEPGSGKAFTLGPDGSNAIKRITFSVLSFLILLFKFFITSLSVVEDL